jgi:hypothetical protein
LSIAPFIREVRTAVETQAAAAPAPLALRLDIGLPGTVPLLAFHDLDNYLSRSYPS